MSAGSFGPRFYAEGAGGAKGQPIRREKLDRLAQPGGRKGWAQPPETKIAASW